MFRYLYVACEYSFFDKSHLDYNIFYLGCLVVYYHYRKYITQEDTPQSSLIQSNFTHHHADVFLINIRAYPLEYV